MRYQSEQLGQILARSICVMLLISMLFVIESGPTHAQDGDGTAVAAEETNSEEPADASADQPEETEIELTEEPNEESTEPIDDTGDEAEVDPVVDEVATEIPPVPSPALAFDPLAAPECIPLSGDSAEPVMAGGTLEYICTYALSLDGTYVDPVSIMLDWSVAVSVGGDWGVQLLDPTGDPSAWTDAGQGSAALGLRTAYSYDTSVGALESLQDIVTIQFGLLLQRPVCTTDPVTLEVDVTGNASIPSSDQATVTSSTAQPLVARIDPVLADSDTSLPTVSIVGVDIDPVSFSLTDTQTHGTLTIQVDNPILQCRPANVLVAIQASTGSEIADAAYLTAVGSLDASGVAAAVPDTSGEGSSLDTPLVVSALPSGTEAGSYQQTIDFELTIPGATGAGLYQLNASAVVEPAE